MLLPLLLVIGTKEADCAFVLLLMAVLWVSEAVPLAVTALFPAVLFPLFGIMRSSEVASVYFKDFHFLLIGVICLATSIEKWGLHRRIALRLVTVVGVRPAWLMLGFMTGCAFLSMWVHNTSAVAMVMPIAEAVLQQIPRSSIDSDGEDNRSFQADGEKGDRLLCKAICLGIAYSSNIGGISTLLGTSPNLIFFEYLHHVLMLLLTWAWLFMGSEDPGFIPGWISLFPHYSGYITDATVALVLGLLFFIAPAHGPSKKYDTMISWKEFQAAMPWTVALLVGGGFASRGCPCGWLGDLPVLATITVACLIVTALTEVASNAATVTIFLPILSPLAEAKGLQSNPLYIMIPTLCTSFSFLLPVSNPPNAVVFAYGHLNVMDMVKAGLGVNVIGGLCVMLAVSTWGVPLFSLETYPDWAPVLPTSNTTLP
uniref:Solute carrier family 13 member 1 n=1 Tax=Knipowitschia caucasica TaxID=637954 RepID=A0AAV2KPT2_KNICA